MNTGMEYEDILIRNQELMAQIEQLHKKIAYLTEQAERWEDDALRLMKERNEALKERDEARREASTFATNKFTDSEAAIRRANDMSRCDPRPAMAFKDQYSMAYAVTRGWDCFKAELFVGDDDHAKEGL